MSVDLANAPNLKHKQALADIQSLLLNDLTATNHIILDQLTSNVPVIQTIARHIINSGGKRLRPIVGIAERQLFRLSRSKNI